MSLVEDLLKVGLSLATIRATSTANLVAKYGLSEVDARYVRQCVTRSGINVRVLDQLLLNNNFTCCCCLGTKGQSIIVHHIVEHQYSQDNSYENLAVLCPVCHDLAHSIRALTLMISVSQLRQAKQSWEEACRNQRFGNRAPAMDSWQARICFDEGGDVLEWVFDLTLSFDGEVVNGYFNIIYLPRGNMILAGEYTHRKGEATDALDFYYWEMSHGIRRSKKKEGEVKLTYVNDEVIRWEMADEILDWVPRVLDLESVKRIGT
jgi:hypothetical protein